MEKGGAPKGRYKCGGNSEAIVERDLPSQNLPSLHYWGHLKRRRSQLRERERQTIKEIGLK